MISNETLSTMRERLFKAHDDIYWCIRVINSEMLSRMADKRREEIKINRIQYADTKDIKY